MSIENSTFVLSMIILHFHFHRRLIYFTSITGKLCINSEKHNKKYFINYFYLNSDVNEKSKIVTLLIGLRVSNQTLGAIVMRYSDKEGRVHFDDFMHCVVKLCAAFGEFV